MENKPEQKLSNEQWAVALDLLADLVDGVAEPTKTIASHSDPAIRSAVENLWNQHKQAERLRFLEKQLTIVGEMTGGGRDVFQPAQLLADRFAILRLLGRGGMGEVYLADDQLVMETVALKTIKRSLAKDRETRARFLSEVQSSRRVTHPNVCRIFDFFEHDGVAFLSMEYLAGPTLAEVLATGPMKVERAQSIAIQVAEGLLSAHQNGILHCDFKPNNIILAGSGKQERAVITDFGLAQALSRGDATAQSSSLAGTPTFMAPELLSGGQPSVRTDIYAFGKVLEALLPGNRIAHQCVAPDAEHRPESLELILRALQGGSTRRNWIVGLTLAGASAAGLMSYQQLRPKMPLGSRQSVQVNGFETESLDSPETTPETTEAVRRLLIMALRQSSLLSVLDDRPYQPAGATEALQAGFPLPLADLIEIARKQNVKLAINGELHAAGKGLRLKISVYDTSSPALPHTTEVQVDDRRALVRLAELAADDLRLNFGESVKHNRYSDLEDIASKDPGAVDCYFRAVSAFEQQHVRLPLVLLDRAIELDPDFTLAHHYRAFVLTAAGMLDSAQTSAERAYAGRNRVGQRERNWIEGLYHHITKAFDESATAYEANSGLFPDEAIFRRLLAHARMRQGRYPEAIEQNRLAYKLDPFSKANASELLVNLAEAGETDQCLAEAAKMEESAGSPTRYGPWLAYMHRGNYDAAAAQSSKLGDNNSEQDSLSKVNSLAPLIMTGRFSEAMQKISGDLHNASATQSDETEQAYTQIRHNLLGQLYRLKDQPAKAAEQADWLIQLPCRACNLYRIREGFALAFDLGEMKLAEQGRDQLNKIAGQWPSSHSLSAASLADGMLKYSHGETGAGVLFERAAAWRDPINLFYVARWRGKENRPELQLNDLAELDKLRGKVFKYHFAGLAVLGWLEQAKCLMKLASFTDSLRMYERVAAHWNKPDAQGSLMRQALAEQAELRRRFK